MLRNYVLTAWRYLLGNRLFSAINTFGLALGLMSCILILLFVRDEMSHDRNLPDAERIVRLHSAFLGEGRQPFRTVRAAGRIMEALRGYAPDLVETGVRMVALQATVILDDKVFPETITFADPDFFRVFGLPLRHGTPETAFSKPMELVVSEEMALKYFGRTDVVGEVLSVCCVEERQLEVRISGVLKDLPRNSHLDIDFLAVLEPSMFAFAPNLLDTWTSVNTYTYFKLREGVQPDDLKQRYWRWLDTESPFVEMLGEDGHPTERLQPNVMAVPDIYLHAREDAGSMGDMRPLGDIGLVYALGCIAVMILVVAAINFMNLSTARASRRAREVALRKVLGASRRQVALQFLGEAVAIALMSLLFALVAVEIVLPVYNQALDRELSLDLLRDIPMLALLLGVAVAVGLLSGSYPALLLSGFRPARILKANQSGAEGGAATVRTLLVVFQYAVSICLVVCTAVIYGQTMYARSLDPGYSVEGKLVLAGLDSSSASKQRRAIARELARIPGVTGVALSSDVPSEDAENNDHFQLLGAAGDALQSEGTLLNLYSVGFGFFEDYDMKLVAGRGFERRHVSDEMVAISDGESRVGRSSVVLNESALRALGLADPHSAIGRVLRSDIYGAGPYDLEIVGVVRDVYFRSIRFGIRPSVYLNYPGTFRSATISYDTADLPGLIDAVERTWKAFLPMQPVAHRFLEDMVVAQYAEESRQGGVFAAFSVLAIVIASLGLYGLASFSAERRTREIGIRKVLGARSRDIVTLLVWQFSLPVLAANLVALPVAFFFMAGWLEGFHYRIGGGFILTAAVVAGLASLLLAWLTVAGRAVSVARANPVRALRYE
jgi:putative ABC transport system permease protein